MFVRQSKYNRLKSELENERLISTVLRKKYIHLIDEWNGLVERVNNKGGEQFLEGEPATDLSKEDIQTLIRLCHPDKHNQSKTATEMTQKLLEMR